VSNLHFYLNGTVGGTDGTEITSLTFKGLHKYMRGDYYNSSLSLPVFLRTTSGYKADNVTVAFKELGHNTYTGCIKPFTVSTTTDTHGWSDYAQYSNQLNLGTITSTNVMILLVLCLSNYYAHDSIAETPMFTFSYVEEVV
jgi:hypothetical protein